MIEQVSTKIVDIRISLFTSSPTSPVVIHINFRELFSIPLKWFQYKLANAPCKKNPLLYVSTITG